MGSQRARPLISADPAPSQTRPEPAIIWGVGHPGGLGWALKGRFGSWAGGSTSQGTKTPPRSGAGSQGRGQDGDLPVNSQREPPETRKKVSMSVGGGGLAPAQASPARSPAAPQLAAPAAAAPPGIFSPRPLLRSASSPRRCGVSAEVGGRGASSAREPVACPAARRAQRIGRTDEAPSGGGAGPQRGPAVSALAHNVRTRRSGETGKRGSRGGGLEREHDATHIPPMCDS